jgi:hypothetical protein
MLLVLSLLALAALVCADIGPKPSMEVVVFYNSSEVNSSFQARMLGCYPEGYGLVDRNLIPELNISEYDSARNCSWMPSRITWGGDCVEGKCSFTYMLPQEFRLAVFLPELNKTFVSGVISRTGFNSQYNLYLFPDGYANVSEAVWYDYGGDDSLLPPVIIKFLVALMLTLVLELLTAFVFLLVARIPKRVLISVFLANLITLPAVWLLFILTDGSMLFMLLSEAFAVVFEALAIFLLNRNVISLKKSALLSALMNAVSLFVGWFVLSI